MVNFKIENKFVYAIGDNEIINQTNSVEAYLLLDISEKLGRLLAPSDTKESTNGGRND